MTKAEMVKKFEAFLDEAERINMFGCVEVEIRDGKPVVMRRTITDKIVDTTRTGDQRATRPYR